LFAAIDWHGVFVPTVSLVEIALRGTLMYLGIFILMRFSRRVVGSISTADMLIVVVVADAAQNGMSAEYHSVTEGAVLVVTIFAWNWFMDWLEFRFPNLQPLLEGRPLPLIRNGRLLRRNMRAEMVTMAELSSQLREHGVEDVSQVKQCCLEADGHLSVITHDDHTDRYPERQSKNG
jgi:uncharacterized membrane protein YcaP (DUF421 family)